MGLVRFFLVDQLRKHMVALGSIAIGVVVGIHVYIVLLETVLFKTRGKKVFRLTEQQANQMQAAMSNQGCYNGFLAAALVLALTSKTPAVADAFAHFGLVCVIVAGLWGTATVGKNILFVQTIPAVAALALYRLGL
jgi:putative membrane protein